MADGNINYSVDLLEVDNWNKMVTGIASEKNEFGSLIKWAGHILFIIDPADIVGPANYVFGGKPIMGEKPVYIILNKPKDYITTSKDPQNRKTVLFTRFI